MVFGCTDRSSQTRSLIISKMYELVCDLGYRKVNMEEVAAAANVSRATVYSHFPDKEELMIAVLRDLTLKDQEVLREIIQSRGSVVERFAKFLEARIKLKLERCRTTQSSLDDLFSLARHRMLAVRAEFLKTDTGLLAELLIEGKLEGTFQVDNAMTAAESMLLATHCFMPYSLTIPELGDLDTLNYRLTAMIDMFLKSLGVKTNSNPKSPTKKGDSSPKVLTNK